MVADFKELAVWRKAMDLCAETYRIAALLPREERYGLADQMKRAAVSIPSNIAEGHARQTQKEFLQFLLIAQGSKAELETQILLTERLGLISKSETVTIHQLYNEVGAMLYSVTQMVSSGTWQ